MRIGYLGPAGSHSHSALLQLQKALPDIHAAEPVPMPNFKLMMEALDRGELPLCVFPIENSLEGSVLEVMESLGLRLYPLQPVCEFLIRVQHALIVRSPEMPLSDIDIVISNPIALAQCAGKLKKLLGDDVRLLPVVSTSEAVRSLGDRSMERTAAIGTAEAARLYQRHVVKNDLSDAPRNVTRFFLLGKDDALPAIDIKPKSRKASLCFGINDKPGGLVELLSIFRDYGINMTRIESRPSKKKLGDYLFYIDLAVDTATDEELQSVLRFLGNGTTYLDVLHPYPSLGLL